MGVRDGTKSAYYDNYCTSRNMERGGDFRCCVAADDSLFFSFIEMYDVLLLAVSRRSTLFFMGESEIP